jgi:hypothetical protein
MKRWRLVTTLSSTVLLVLSGAWVADNVNAGGPRFITNRGEPFKWRVSPVPFTPDQGPLGGFDHEAAVKLIGGAFQTWENVQTATIRFEPSGQLGLDVTGANIMDFLNHIARDVNPFIFDDDGSIIDGLAGEGASDSIVGFASPTLRPPGIARGEFRQGWAVFNGLFAGKRILTDAFRATLIHEIGHFIGLDHTQLSVDHAFDHLPSDNGDIPTMFPFLASASQARLHPDDVAAVSSIYPAPSFAATTGRIQGHVLMPNGVTGFQGANVVAHRLEFPSIELSSISGDLYTSNRRTMGGNGSTNPALRGYYQIVGLPPGFYTVRIEEIYPGFTGGSSLGPLDPPARLISEPELYSGSLESNHDGALNAAFVRVDAGSVVEDVDIVLNGDFPSNDFCSTATVIKGNTFKDHLDTTYAAGEDDDPIHACTARADSNSVWYSFTPPTSGVIVADTSNSDYNTVLSAYSGSCRMAAEVACNDDISQNNVLSQIVFGAKAGAPYQIEVNDNDNRVGGGRLSFHFQFYPNTLLPEHEPNEALSQAQRLSRPGGIIGEIGPGDAAEVAVNLQGRTERLEDVYTLTLDRADLVQINLVLDRPDVEAEVVLFTSDGSTTTVIAQDSSVGVSKIVGPLKLARGIYYVGVSISDRVPPRNRTTYTLAIN